MLHLKKGYQMINGLWIGPELSGMEQLSIKSFLNNGYPFHLYAYEDVKNVPQGTKIMDANNILPEEKIFKNPLQDSFSFFANLFRYKLLYERGGIWTDMDIICLDKIPESDYIFAGERIKKGFKTQANCCFIKTPPKTDIMKWCFDKAQQRKPESISWGQTGPLLLSEAIDIFEMNSYILPWDAVSPVSWWKVSHFITTGIRQHLTWKKIRKKSFAVHLFNEMWRKSGLDKNAIFPEKSIYEKMRKLYK